MKILEVVCFMLVVASVTSAKKSVYMTEYSPNGKCALYQGGCTYEIALTRKDCGMAQDEPVKTYVYPPEPELDKKSTKSNDPSIRVLEDLEQKLTKMMEGLSIRSLRHIRQIRQDINKITTNLDLLKQTGAAPGTKSQENSVETGNRKQKRHLTCPPDFLGVGTWPSCFKFSNFNATWHEAREYCSALGADLVTLDSVKESYIIELLIKGNPQFQLPKGWWTSGNYNVRNKKWMWTTKHHYQAYQFKRWAPGEPDSRSTMHCMLLYKHASYRWHDAMCTDRHNFICEIAF